MDSRVRATTRISKETYPHLTIGAFTFKREPTGRVVLDVDVESGMYPLRLTHEQTYMLTQWLDTHQVEETD